MKQVLKIQRIQQHKVFYDKYTAKILINFDTWRFFRKMKAGEWVEDYKKELREELKKKVFNRFEKVPEKFMLSVYGGMCALFMYFENQEQATSALSDLQHSGFLNYASSGEYHIAVDENLQSKNIRFCNDLPFNARFSVNIGIFEDGLSRELDELRSIIDQNPSSFILNEDLRSRLYDEHYFRYCYVNQINQVIYTNDHNLCLLLDLTIGNKAFELREYWTFDELKEYRKSGIIPVNSQFNESLKESHEN